MKLFRNTMLALSAVAGLFALTTAFAGNTIFLTDRNGQITFPISPPNRATGGPGFIDNMTIGATTPQPGTFTVLNSASQACTSTPCVKQGLNAAQGGSIETRGGTSSTSANAGGAANLTGGTPGATGIGGAASVTGGAGGATSGSGGAANLIGGAGTAGNANGGSAVISGGAANGSGVAGSVRELGLVMRAQGAQATQDTAATLTAAQLTSGIIQSTPVGAINLTLPLQSAMDTAIPDAANNDAFDFSIINTSGGANTITVLANSWTTVGVLTIAQNVSGRFRARKTGTGAWTLYRIS